MKIKELFIYPILIMILTGLVIQLILPIYFKKEDKRLNYKEDKRLEYKIEGPTKITYDPKAGQPEFKCEINKKDYLFVYDILIKNTGDSVIKNLPILYIFDDASKQFKILSVTQTTEPAYEFGKVQLLSSNYNSRKYVYDLINKGDEILITFLTSEYSQPSVYAKAPDLKFVKETGETKDYSTFLVTFAVVIAFIASFISLLAKSFNDGLLKKIKANFSLGLPSKQKDNIGEIFNGEWKLIFSRDSFTQSEIVTIDNKGRYFKSGKHAYNLHCRIINADTKQISFNKISTNGELYSNETLVITNDNLIQGEDSLGFKLVYIKENKK